LIVDSKFLIFRVAPLIFADIAWLWNLWWLSECSSTTLDDSGGSSNSSKNSCFSEATSGERDLYCSWSELVRIFNGSI